MIVQRVTTSGKFLLISGILAVTPMILANNSVSGYNSGGKNRISALGAKECQSHVSGTYTVSEIEEGKELFHWHGCKSCHGPEGLGDGPAGAGLNPPPRNFTKLDYLQGCTYSNIMKSIEAGVSGTGMASYGHLPEEERHLITLFILHTQTSGK